MMNRFRKHLTYANVAASFALFFAVTGAAYAATLITSAKIKNGSLTSTQFKDGSLTASDLAPATRASFVGPPGSRGGTGWDGDTGPKGPDGAPGDPGPPPRLTSSWAWQNTGLVTDSSSDANTPNSPMLDWDNPNYGHGLGGASPNLRTPGSYAARHLDHSYQMVLALQGMTGGAPNQQVGSQSLISLPWPGKLTATATLTFLHRNDGEDLATNGSATPGTLRHARLECKLTYGSGSVYSTTTMGATTYVSSNVRHELVNATLTGNADTSVNALPAGTYNVAVQCRDADATTTTNSRQWSFVGGNMVVVGSGA